MTFSDRHSARSLLRIGAGAALCAACAATAYAAAPVTDELKGCATSSLSELDRVRGGFSLTDANGELQIAVGIEHAVFVNGILKVSTKFDIPLRGPQGSAGANTAAAIIVQNGSGNYFIPANAADLPSSAMTLVQNSLDNQTISNLNIINATVTSRDLLRSMALASSLHETIAAAIR